MGSGWRTELRSKELVQPCWLKEGEMKRISSGQLRKEVPTASPGWGESEG